MRKAAGSGKKKWWNMIFVVALAVVVAGGCLNPGWFHTAYAVTSEEDMFPEDTADGSADVYDGIEMEDTSGSAGTVYSAGSDGTESAADFTIESAEENPADRDDAVDAVDPYAESSADDYVADAADPYAESTTDDDVIVVADPYVESVTGEAVDAADPYAESTTDEAPDSVPASDFSAGEAAEAVDVVDDADPDCVDEPDAEEEDAGQSEEGEIVSLEISFVPDAGSLPDSDALFEGYLESLFYGDYGIATMANYGQTVLEGKPLTLYTTLRGLVEEVAAGTRSSTIFALDPSDYSWTAKELGTDAADSDVLYSLMTDEVYFLTAEAVSCLLMDCPYELYWYDKLSGVGISFSIRYTTNSDGTLDSVELSQFVLAFYVAEDYQGSSNVTVNTQRAASAQAAAANAQSIVASYSGLSDREKMAAYRDEICALVSYNYSAINNPDVSYGDPWQLVYVFDRDPDTNVVCEGYAKAFQYLCDLGLSNSTSYLVTGTMSGGTGAGAHMWNVVHLDDGYNYLVDVTNCDTGTIGANGGLFLVNGDSDNCVDAEDPDEYDFQIGRTTVKYLYDEHTTGLYSYAIRTLGTSHIFKIDEEPAEDTELTYGYTDATISVEAHVDDSLEITYQWYMVEEDETGEIISYQIIEGATDHTLVIPEGIPAGTTVTFICVIDHGASELVSHDAVVTVGKKTLTPAVSGTASKTYDGTTDVNGGLTISLDGVVGDDDVTASANFEYVSADAASGIGVSVTGIELSGEAASNYELSETELSATGTILAKTLTPSISGTASKTYDGTTDVSGLTINLDGVVEGDDVSARATYKYVSADAGSGIEVLVTGIALTGADASNYVLSRTSLSTTGEILPKTVTPVLSGAVSMTYDGRTDAGRLSVTLDGVVEGDDVTAYADCEFESADAGSGIAVSLKDLELSGVDASNYVLSSTEYSATGTIEPKKVSATLEGKASKIYDRKTDVNADELSISLEGVLEGDDVTVSASYEYDSADVGSSVTVYAKDISLGGADASNYVLSVTSLSSAGEILPKTVTPVLIGSAFKTYDGTTDVTGLSISLNGVLKGDDVTASAISEYANADVGSDIAVSVTDITLGGADAANYELSVTELSATGAITPKTLTKSMVSLEKDSYVYTGKPITPEVAVSDIVNGFERITSDDYEVTYADNTDITENATVTITGKGNYTGSVTLTFAIIAGEEEPDTEKPGDGGTGGSGGSSAGAKKDDGATDSSGATSTGSVRTSDRELISPIRTGMFLILIVDAALVMAMIRRKRPE